MAMRFLTTSCCYLSIWKCQCIGISCIVDVQHGGAVALGHPIGCSGARVITTLLYALQDRNKETGLATLCLGGGNAVTMIVKRE